jgi:hypothetical protein
MSKITKQIPPQAVEWIRDRIGVILKDEIAAQISMPGTKLPMDIEVYAERCIPFDMEELPAINVSVDAGSWDNKHPGEADVTCVFNIDCIVNAKHTLDDMGDKLAAIKAQTMLGVVRYILEDPIYYTLGFEAPFIQRTWCSDFLLGNERSTDEKETQVARLKFNVRASDNNDLISPQLIDGYDTNVKIEETNSGYKYQGDTYQ